MVTGGPESLHNLVAVMNSMGYQATIVYFPFNKPAFVPEAYKKYKITSEVLDDQKDNLIIFPEIYCMAALKIRNATAGIWWLSLDNFLERKYHNFRDAIRYFKKVLRGLRPLRGITQLKHLLHFSKANYDEDFLMKNGVPFVRLSGPISNFYLENHAIGTERRDFILYNPQKGRETINKLIATFPQFHFVPLINMSELDLRYAYRSSKLYIDFGHHPGKERMPREAAISGCCIITGRKGSAGNLLDIPIPEEFKIDESLSNFTDLFGEAAHQVICNFPQVSNKFDSYRQTILSEVSMQKDDLRNILLE